MLRELNQRLLPSMPVAGFSRRVHCEGGDTTVINGMRYHVFTSTQNLTVVRGGTVYAMVVAAGGSPRPSGASIFVAGGGGGGGLANYLPIVVPEGSYQLVTIGAAVTQSRGGSSSIVCLRPAELTGGGTSGHGGTDSLEDGGSGGGGTATAGTFGTGDTPAFIPSQGNNGGLASGGSYGGGGGGFSAVASGKNGGSGLALDADTVSLGSLINNSTHFSSGGGGAGDPNTGGSDGAGGTGAGKGNYAYDATSATMFGCGGGGGPNNASLPTSGYQGIVIIKYPVG